MGRECFWSFTLCDCVDRAVFTPKLYRARPFELAGATAPSLTIDRGSGNGSKWTPSELEKNNPIKIQNTMKCRCIGLCSGRFMNARVFC